MTTKIKTKNANYLLSTYTLFSLPEFTHLLPADMIPKKHMTFKHMVPVSATTGFGIDKLKSCIRESLDEDAAMATKDIHQERLEALRSPSHGQL